MLVDSFAPNPPFSIERSVVIEAQPIAVMRAALAANLLDAPVARVMTSARDFPNRVVARFRGRPVEPAVDRIAFADIADSDEWQELGEIPGQEWVCGAIGQFWRRDFGWVQFEPENFVDFETPGYAKTLISLRVEPLEERRTRLVYESRTIATDDEGLRKFTRYWRVLRPFVGGLMSSALGSMQREAERGGDTTPEPGQARV